MIFTLILLDISKILDGLGACLIFIGGWFLVSYLFALISKIGGGTLVSRSGAVISRPTDADEIHKNIKLQAKRIAEISKNVFERIGSGVEGDKYDVEKLLNDRMTSKLNQIQKIVELRVEGFLTDEEFNFLKDEILKSMSYKELEEANKSISRK